MTYMYKGTVTKNPFKGCLFKCSYCEKSFQRQAKRQKNKCMDCYNYIPHFHPERLNDYLPKNKLIFYCGNGDIAFAKPRWIEQILEVIENKSDRTFLLQTKKPSCLHKYRIPDNCLVGTTIETNRDTSLISKAPEPYKRYFRLNSLICRKFVTIEPILAFDMDIMKRWIKNINPEIVWVGYCNYINGLKLNEPSLNKTKKLIDYLNSFTDVRLKTMREKLTDLTVNNVKKINR